MTSNLFRQILQRPTGVLCAALLAVLYLIAIFAAVISPYAPSDQNLAKTYHPPTGLVWHDGRLCVRVYKLVDPTEALYRAEPDRLAPVHFWAKSAPYKLWGFIPMEHRLFGVDSAERIYLLGSDSTGRDVFSRLLYGSQVSLSIGLIGIFITTVIGVTVGGLSGYFGGPLDNVTMRLTELLMAVPDLYLIIALRAALSAYFDSGQIFLLIVGILSFIGWSGTARVIRGLTLSLRNRPFIHAAEALGQTPFVILWKHLFPNLLGYLIVTSTLSIPGYILGEAALSFLGIGIQEPSTSWGLMLSQAQDMKVFMLNFWWLLTPGLAIFVTVILFNALGDVLRDIVDPKLKTQV